MILAFEIGKSTYEMLVNCAFLLVQLSCYLLVVINLFGLNRSKYSRSGFNGSNAEFDWEFREWKDGKCDYVFGINIREVSIGGLNLLAVIPNLIGSSCDYL